MHNPFNDLVLTSSVSGKWETPVPVFSQEGGGDIPGSKIKKGPSFATWEKLKKNRVLVWN